MSGCINARMKRYAIFDSLMPLDRKYFLKDNH